MKFSRYLFLYTAVWSLCGFTSCISHRVDSIENFENSPSAFRSALQKEYEGIEFDVHHTADGVPIILHDDDLNRVVRSKPGAHLRPIGLAINQVDWATLKANCQLLNGDDLAGLSFALQMFAPTNKIVFIDLKDKPTKSTLELIEKYYINKPENIRVTAFNTELFGPINSQATQAILYKS